MTTNSIEKEIANHAFTATGEQDIKLSQFKNKNIVLYFYPKDSTPGCTIEGRDFRDNLKKFEKLNTVILGVSRDSIKSHERFKEKQAFNFELLSDADEILCNHFDVLKQKSMFGKKYIGIERSTFLIDKKGKIAKEWRKVKINGHVAEVLEAVKALQ